MLALTSGGWHFQSAMGVGDGTFQPGFAFPVGYSSTGPPLTKDFNADGHLDVAVPIMWTFPFMPMPNFEVRIFEGSASGEFTPSSGVTLANLGSFLIAGNFNQDNRPDLAALIPGQNMVSVFVAKADRNFEPGVNYSLGTRPVQGTTADVDGDSRLDLVVSHEAGGISILKGLGNGAFEPAVLVTPNATGCVVSGDFNGDGRADLLSVTLENKLGLWLNQGNGQFNAGMEYPLAWNPGKIVLADLNGDGRLDVVVENSGGVTVFIANGDGTLRPHSNHPVGESPHSLVVADFTSDGRPDIAVVSGALIRRLSLLENRCAASETRLTFEKRDGQLWILWGTSEPGTLETTTNLVSPQWENVLGEPVIEGEQIKMSAPLGDPTRYFRLRGAP